MACREWKLRIIRSSSKEMYLKDFQDYIIKSFLNPKVRKSIRETLKLLIKDPLSYARGKIGYRYFWK
ncbi:hypothetical protein SACC_10930 [Saccharolobus caldissimus]|uniref:Uncharacterized protein n=1 Tax=Saccharolobus caldissimus TaxID=1702097 RepID=A0AAQ4CQJ5_9CREN|nr:hypothetical protein SACC_10930 [Saccharolobus caldissimus]